MPWGYTGIFELENGGGLFGMSRALSDRQPKADWQSSQGVPEQSRQSHMGFQRYIRCSHCNFFFPINVLINLKGVYATSRHIPGVRFAGVSHPGLIGTAPSAELLATWNKREGALIAEHKALNGGVDPVPAVALPPEPKGAYVGQDLPDEVREKIAKEGARTIPGREHGGNCDIKNLSRGSRCYFPVFVKGANLSVGDLHFSQGDVRIPHRSIDLSVLSDFPFFT